MTLGRMRRRWTMRLRLGLLGVLLGSCVTSAQAVPSYAEVKAQFLSSETQLLDRRGEVIATLRTNPKVRQGQWVSLAEISPALRTAMLLSEDKRFYEHSGVDWQAVSAAAWGNLWQSKTRGASTITMQLAGLLEHQDKYQGRRSMVQKIGQSFTAQVLEQYWRKDQILEAYLNAVPFRGEIVGIDALSRTLFGKAPHGLNDQEAVVAAALVRAPNAPQAQVAQRACGLLKLMRPTGDTAVCGSFQYLVPLYLENKAFPVSTGIAPHYLRYRMKAGPHQPGQAVTSTLSAPLQRFAQQSLQKHLRELEGRNVQDGAVVVLDNATGEVLAWVGSSGELSRAENVDAVLSLRQPGSTLKPLLYTQAIEEKRITAASLLDDTPTNIATTGGLYIPQNYDHQFKGLVSARTALASSLNIPAVRTLVMVTPRAFHQRLKALGLPLKESGDYYGYSLALGSADVSLLSLTNAYRALSNGGVYSAVRTVSGAAQTATRLYSPQAVFIVSDILSDTNARARTFGTDSILATRYWTAVKTGTSKDMRDNWALGYSEKYTVGVWVGNAKGGAMWNVSGTAGAAPVWADIMNYLHQSTPSRAPTAPAGLVRTNVTYDAHLEAARKEWFIAGTEQSRFTQAGATPDAAKQNKFGTRIVMPASGTIVALDPDIPPANQRLEFIADGPQVKWLMDDKEVSKQAKFKWLPWPGRHVVKLLGSNGQVLDTLRIEVRGAGVKQEVKKIAQQKSSAH